MRAMFIKFYNLKPCSHEEFVMARNYYLCEASAGEKRYFDEAIKTILNRSAQYLADLGTVNISLAYKIYRYYGLHDEDFQKYFDKYMGFKRLTAIVKRNLPRRLYLEAKKQLFSNEVISRLAEIEKISPLDCRMHIFGYACNNHPIDKHSFPKFRSFYVAFKSFDVNNLKFFKSGYQYCRYYATEEEKQEFFQKVLQVMDKLNSIAQESDTALEDFLEAQNLSVFNLVPLLQFFGDKNLEFTKLVCGFYKEYYEMAEKVGFKLSALKSLCERENIDYKIFIPSIKLYAKFILLDKNFNQRVDGCNERGNRNEAVLEEILRENDEARIIELFMNNPKAVCYIADFCYAKNKFKSREEQVDMERILLQKKQIFFDYLKQNNLTLEGPSKPRVYSNSSKSNIVLIAKQIINGDISFMEAQEILNLGYGRLVPYIKSYLEYYPELENQFNEVLESYKSILNELYNLLAIYIQNGVQGINGMRNFDFLDYFMIFKDINPKSNAYLHLNLTPQIISCIRRFLDGFDPTRYNLDTLVKSKFTLVVNGEYRTLREEEIAGIAQYLESMNIPLYGVVVDSALKRYANNELDTTPLQPGRI